MKFLKIVFKLLIWTCLLIFVGLSLVYAFYYFTQETETLNESTRSKLSGQFIKLSDGFVHYELAGPDTGKAVILIHGAGSGYYAWDKNFNYLAANGFRVLQYDLYGRGFSDRPEVNYDPELFEQQLQELIDTLHFKKPYSIVSVSMGAIIAVKHTLLHPESVKSLILVDPAALNDPGKPISLKMPVLSDFLMAAYWYPRAIQKQMREFYDPQKVAEYEIVSANQMKFKGFKRAMKSTWLYTLNQNVQQELYEIGKSGKNVLLLWGKNDPLISPKVSEHYIKAIPQIQFHEIDSAGHLANYERPQVVNLLITQFLRNQ